MKPGKFKIKTFIAKNGERISQLYDTEKGGFPLYYPTAYIARSIRTNSTHETQKVHLEAIKRLYEWTIFQEIDLTKRFQQHSFLRLNEIDSLSNYLGAKRTGAKGQTISRSKHNIYINYSKNFLDWLAKEVITSTNNVTVKNDIEQQKKAMENKINRKCGSKSARNQRIITKFLPEDTYLELIDLFKNPFKNLLKTCNKGPRIRNITMLIIIYETGMRLGELLSLKMSSFEESRGSTHSSINIERNHNDIFDSRENQPVVKTLGRQVPITEATENLIIEYRDNWRAEIPNVGFSENDFLFINHRAGPSQGKPITKTSFNSAINNLKKLFPALEPLHPHLLRHDWNYRFSKKAKESGLEFEDERKTREYLMGWCHNSEMSLVYDLRYIQEKAHEVGLKVASDVNRR